MSIEIKPIAEFIDNEAVLERVPKELLLMADKRLPWTGYLGFEEGQLIGMCGFKDEPTEEGTVEIAYFTFPENEGRGCATGMARGLVALAVDSREVTFVLAHTLKEENASTKILKRLDFDFKGEVMDPEDGSVWRWSKEV
ncbi:MAG: GNAT family N-acetyltransferase [Opitutales bacterium]|nr:GNAT family N-acetyltransferase [Opitutales bacterium]